MSKKLITHAKIEVGKDKLIIIRIGIAHNENRDKAWSEKRAREVLVKISENKGCKDGYTDYYAHY